MVSTNTPLSSPRLRVGLVLADRFTLSTFGDLADVLRLSADEGDRSRQSIAVGAYSLPT